MSKPEHQWEKLVKAARKVPPEEANEAPPGEFVSRIVGFRDAVAAFARTLAWRRWSLWVALLSAMVFLVVLAVTRCNREPEPLIAPPPLISPQP